MRELMVHSADLRSPVQQLSDQAQSLHSILKLVEAGGLVVNRFGGGYRQEPSVEFCRPSHQASRLVVISEVVNILDPDTGGFEAVPDGLVRQPSGLADADAADARQLLLLDGGDDPPIFEQRRRRITLMSRYSQDVHINRAKIPTANLHLLGTRAVFLSPAHTSRAPAHPSPSS